MSQLTQNFLIRITSRKFLLTVLGVVIVIFNKWFNWGLDIASLLMIIGIIGSFIGVEGMADIQRVDKIITDVNSDINGSMGMTLGSNDTNTNIVMKTTN